MRGARGLRLYEIGASQIRAAAVSARRSGCPKRKGAPVLSPEPYQVDPSVNPPATGPQTVVLLLASVVLVATFMVLAWGTLGDDASADRMLLLPLVAMLLGGVLLRVTWLGSRSFPVAIPPKRPTGRPLELPVE